MKRKALVSVIVLTAAFFTCDLFAGYDPAVNPLDPGQESISLINGVFVFEGQVAYDVYAPGEFVEDIIAFDQSVISAASFADQYVYQYQISSTAGIGNSISIALVSNSGAGNYGYVASVGDAVPNGIYDAGSQVLYSFVVMEGQSTAKLILTSPFAPTAGDAMVSGMMAGSQGVVVPVPVPEPMTLLLLGAGCLPLRYYRKRAR